MRTRRTRVRRTKKKSGVKDKSRMKGLKVRAKSREGGKAMQVQAQQTPRTSQMIKAEACHNRWLLIFIDSNLFDFWKKKSKSSLRTKMGLVLSSQYATCCCCEGTLSCTAMRWRSATATWPLCWESSFWHTNTARPTTSPASTTRPM
eukprot:Lithocolla_globosa_v1_NODE_4294_length_1469_cov_17.815417.p2 type:complete len:147 gc:universal NODE_4294_length_1469_cov_17.815417:321-761(+)